MSTNNFCKTPSFHSTFELMIVQYRQGSLDDPEGMRIHSWFPSRADKKSLYANVRINLVGLNPTRAPALKRTLHWILDKTFPGGELGDGQCGDFQSNEEFVAPYAVTWDVDRTQFDFLYARLAALFDHRATWLFATVTQLDSKHYFIHRFEIHRDQTLACNAPSSPAAYTNFLKRTIPSLPYTLVVAAAETIARQLLSERDLLLVQHDLPRELHPPIATRWFSQNWNSFLQE